jgi:TRAP-type C4-dicarboxylate transport system substrate-binding protein
MFISRYWLVVLSVMMVVAVIIGGCAPSAAPAPSSKPSTPAVSPPADKPIELRFSHQNPPVGRVTEKAINPWAKRVEEATKGKLKVTVYPANALNAPEQALEAVNGGICDIVWTPLGYYPSRFPLSDVITLPFMNLPQGKIGSRILSPGEVNSHMLQELYETSPEIQAEYKDFKVLLLHTTEPFILFSSKKPLRNQADVKGIQVRELRCGNYWGQTPCFCLCPIVTIQPAKVLLMPSQLHGPRFPASNFLKSTNITLMFPSAYRNS